MIYFDNAATTKVCDAAIKAVCNNMKNDFGNPSSLHKLGLNAENILTASKKTLANALGCDFDSVYFTSGATESNNMAVIGTALAAKRSGNKIVTTAIEHPSVSCAIDFLENSHGYQVVRVKPDSSGNIDPEQIIQQVDQNTILVACMHVNNETGAMLQVEQVADAVKKKNKNTLVHIDAVQSFCKIPFKASKLNIDTLSISGHKIHGPKGVGAVYIKKGTKINPILFGGGQQKGVRPGTESISLIAGLAACVEQMYAQIDKNLKLYYNLNSHLMQLISDIKGIKLNSPKGAAPHIVNMSVQGIRSEVMLHFLEQNDIFVSSGSSCSKGKKSPVLTAMGLSDRDIDSAIRLSFCNDNNIDEIDEFVKVLKQGIDSLIKF